MVGEELANVLAIFFSGQLLFAALVTGSLYALTALGLNLVYGTMRMLNVAHGELVMLGAYGAYWGITLLGVSPLVAAPVLALAGAVVGAAVYRFIVQRMISPQAGAGRERLEGNSLLLFFGLSLLLQNLSALAFTPNNRSYDYLSGVLRVGDVAMSENRLAVLAIAGLACIAVSLYLLRSVGGIALRAVIEREEAAMVVGVNVARVHLVSFAVGFGSAALAGVLVSMLEQISPFAGFQFTIAAFIVIILGGLGNVKVGMLAALLLGFVETYGVALTTPNLRSVLLYATFVVSILVFPRGLFGVSATRT